jgi:hypothetical protein
MDSAMTIQARKVDSSLLILIQDVLVRIRLWWLVVAVLLAVVIDLAAVWIALSQ